MAKDKDPEIKKDISVEITRANGFTSLKVYVDKALAVLESLNGSDDDAKVVAEAEKVVKEDYPVFYTKESWKNVKVS